MELVVVELGRKYPATVATWQTAWERFTPFLEFPPEVRRISHTTNAIESLNYQPRKIITNRGHFPNDTAVVKLLWLAIRDIENKRARERFKDRGLPPNQRKAPGHLVEVSPGRRSGRDTVHDGAGGLRFWVLHTADVPEASVLREFPHAR